MKTSLFIALTPLLTFSVAHAGCEDGAAMAEQAVINKYNIRPSCGVVSKPYGFKATQDGEIHRVEVICRGQPTDAYEVKLVEIEDAVCTVESITPLDL